MVYMSGSKKARLQDSIINRTNVCGGVKKAGTAPTVGWFLTSNVRLTGAPHSNPVLCLPSVSRVIRTQRYGYKATL
jgi:hypothetical protein